MACTAYIFEQDFNRLTTRELSHASQRQKGGSLFGQWTSTGNPVIHFAMPYSASEYDRNKKGKELYEGFRICYIGEWRPVSTRQFGDDHSEMKARRELRREDAPARFLVLDVSKADITPFLFESQAQKGRGILEKLPGENPFNKSEAFRPSQSTTNYNNPQRYSQPSGAEVYRQGPSRPKGQYQEAITTKPQWYSADDGSKKLQKVLEEFREIARGGRVELSRDSRSQDISMTFTDTRRGREWEIQFSPAFPKDGALLIRNPGTSQRKDVQRIPGKDLASDVINDIKRWIV